jgi:hypothetical protein
MKKNELKKLKKQTPVEQQKLKEIFTPEEIVKINQLVNDLKKIRQIDRSDPNIDIQIEKIIEQQYYFVGDFLIAEGWITDKSKIEALWKYLELEFK